MIKNNKNAKKQIDQHYLLDEITKNEILLGLFMIVDTIENDFQATDEDVIEAIMELIVKTDLGTGTMIDKIWRDCQ